MIRFLICFLLFSFKVGAFSVTNLNWPHIDAKWVKDDELPLFTIVVAYEDGSLKDSQDKLGITNLMFSSIFDGTSKLNQQEIAAQLNYWGATITPQITKDRSYIFISGLTKDAIDITKFYCHLMNEASFPELELKNSVIRLKSSLQNITADQRGLSLRAWEYINNLNNGENLFLSGTLKTLDSIKQADLFLNKNYFLKEVKKKIYLHGPASLLNLKKIIGNNCQFPANENLYSRRVSEVKSSNQSSGVYFLAQENVNQAQIRMGVSKINSEKINETDVDFLMNYLGQGFSSMLMKELRTKRGLVYGAGSKVSFDAKNFGSIIATSTRTEKVSETLQVINNIVANLQQTEVSPIEIESRKDKMSVLRSFSLEGSEDLLMKMIEMDYRGISLSEIDAYTKNIDNIKSSEVKKLAYYFYPQDQMKILLVGQSAILKSLKIDKKKIHIIHLNDLL